MPDDIYDVLFGIPSAPANYGDEQSIVETLIRSWHAAERGDTATAETELNLATTDIENWEPYDTSDGYFRMHWNTAIERIRRRMQT